MRKIIGDTLYQDGGISGSDKKMIEDAAKRLYPGKDYKISKHSVYGYVIWVPVGKVQKGQPTDAVSLMVAQFKQNAPAFRQTAKNLAQDIRPNKLSADIYALQLISEYGSTATVKAAWKKAYGGKSINFLRTEVGLIGLAYSGRLTKADVQLIGDWAGE